MSPAISDEDRIRGALSFVPADDRDLWIRMGMAVQSELGEDGFDLWDEWSQRSDAYNERDARSAWRSFKGGGLKIASLFKEAHDLGYSDHSMPKRVDPQERARREAERSARDAQDQARREAAAALADGIWSAATPSDGTHAYLRSKGISANGARVGDWPVVDGACAEFRVNGIRFTAEACGPRTGW